MGQGTFDYFAVFADSSCLLQLYVVDCLPQQVASEMFNTTCRGHYSQYDSGSMMMVNWLSKVTKNELEAVLSA